MSEKMPNITSASDSNLNKEDKPALTPEAPADSGKEKPKMTPEEAAAIKAFLEEQGAGVSGGNESAGSKKNDFLKITPASKKQEAPVAAGVLRDKPGSTKESPIELTEVVEAKSTEQLKQEMEKTRAEYIKSEIDAKKADKILSKLGRLRERLFGAKKEEADDKKGSTAKRDKDELKKFSEEKKNAYEEAKKVFGKGLYEEKIESFEEKIKTGGKEGGPMTPKEQETALANLKFEVVKTAILDENKILNEAKIAALPEKERGVFVKAMARYGQLPQPARILISAGVATGMTLAFSSGVGFAMVGGVFAWKALRAGIGTTAGLLAGKGYNWAFNKIVDVKNIKNKGEQEIINEIKSSLVNQGEQKDNLTENKTEKKEEKFEKWFSGLSAATNEKLDKLATKEKRILLGKAIGQGVVIAGVAGLTSWGMEKGMSSLDPNLASKMGIRLASPENAPKVKVAGAESPSPEDLDSTTGGVESFPPPASKEIINLEIGARGPEGAIIDNFRANPKLAETFGFDPKGGISLDKWAGTKAHRLWLASVEGDLKNPKIIAELAKRGYEANPEDYAKAMHKIGKGFVELDPQGHMHLTDNTSFLKAISETKPSSPSDMADFTKETPEEFIVGPEIPKPDAPGAEVMASEALPETPEILIAPEVSLTPEEVINNQIKKAVTNLFNPEILTDRTFSAAAKVPLGKILEAVPPEAYEDKYALSHYWHSLGEIGVKTPDLPGTGFLGYLSYDDFRKYSEVAKFLRENAGVGGAEKLKDMTMADFLKVYGGDLDMAAGK